MSEIYKIQVSVTVYAYKNSRLNIFDLAEAVSDEIILENHSIISELVKSADDLSEDVLKSLPYGEDGDLKTIREWLEDGKS